MEDHDEDDAREKPPSERDTLPGPLENDEDGQ